MACVVRGRTGLEPNHGLENFYARGKHEASTGTALSTAMKTHLCKRCQEHHPLVYRLDQYGNKNLVYTCPKTNESFGLPMVEGLSIQTHLTKKAARVEKKKVFAEQNPGLGFELAAPTPLAAEIEQAAQIAVIQFDGGCGPTNPGNSYGSYAITIDGNVINERNRVQFGHGTNNTGEFNALILGLDGLLGHFRDHGITPSSFSVHMLTDSTIVRNWIQRYDAAKAAKITEIRRKVMAEHAAQCIERMRQFHSYTIEWQGRDHNVAVFGH